MDNDAKMIQSSGMALTTIQIKYRASSIKNRILLRPTLEQALNDYAQYQIRLLKEGIISTEDDVSEMNELRDEIEKAGKSQQLIEGIARFIGFVAVRI